MAQYNRIITSKLVSQQPFSKELRCHFKTIATLKTINTKPSTKPTPEEAEWNNAKPFHEMPGPKVVPLLGTSWTYFPKIGHGMKPSQQIDIARHNAEKYGTIWKEKFPGGITLVSTTSVQDSEKLFRAESKYPNRPSLDALLKYRSDNKDKYNSAGIVANGKGWWDVRSISQQILLKPKTINKYIPSIGQISDEFVDRIRLIRPESNEMNDDFLNELYRWALESIGVSALNTRLGCFDPNLTDDSEAMRIISATATVFRTLNHLTVSLPLWKYYKTPIVRELHEALDFLYDVMMKYIGEATENLKSRPKDSDEEVSSFLDEILMKGMSYKDAAPLVMDTMLGGIDTTAHWVAYHLYLLARNPEKQEKLREEIFRVVGPAKSPVTVELLNKMPFLKASTKETLRMMPVTIANARYTDKDMVFSGYQVPKGVILQTCHILISSSEEHFERPKEYIPERWIRGHPMEGCPHAHSSLPFGFGKRMCLGRRLAELEIWNITIKILQNFKIEYHHEDIDCVATLISKPNKPLLYRFTDL